MDINITSMEFWVQAISIFAMAFQIIAFQFRKNTTYLILHGTGGIAFAVSFFLMGPSGYSSALINTVGVAKSFTFAHHNKKMFQRVFLILFICLYAAVTVATTIITGKFEWISFLILLAQIVGTVAIWTDSARIIRIVQLVFVSPVWIVNCIINFSLGGIICHIFIIISIIISIKRFGWDGLAGKK